MAAESTETEDVSFGVKALSLSASMSEPLYAAVISAGYRELYVTVVIVSVSVDVAG